MPSRKYITETVLVEMYELLKKKIFDQISAKTISVTSDIWTCINNMQCFLSFSVHWLDNKFVLQHRVLQMKSFSEQHTAHNIQCALEEIAEAWNISNKINVIVTDNGRYIVKAVNDSRFEGKTCFIHTLQRAIHGALEAQESVNEAIATGRRIVTHFHYSKPAQEKLQLIQTELNVRTNTNLCLSTNLFKTSALAGIAFFIWLKGYWSKRERFRYTYLTTVTQ